MTKMFISISFDNGAVTQYTSLLSDVKSLLLNPARVSVCVCVCVCVYVCVCVCISVVPINSSKQSFNSPNLLSENKAVNHFQ